MKVVRDRPSRIRRGLHKKSCGVKFIGMNEVRQAVLEVVVSSSHGGLSYVPR